MLKTLPQSEILVPNSRNPQKAVEYINSYVNNSPCKNMNVDISFMNAIDASYVSTMCSTNHYIKYPDGKINWLVSSKLTKELSNRLTLGNSDFILK